jgi:hypothetical protein
MYYSYKNESLKFLIFCNYKLFKGKLLKLSEIFDPIKKRIEFELMERLINKLYFIPLIIRRKIIELFRKITRNTRVLPDFVLIGAMKSGTTALIHYLSEHPSIKLPLFQREVHFFDGNFYRGVKWYKSFFPTKIYKSFITKFRNQSFLTGEKTPLYIFHPLAPQRLYSVLPNVKLILLLRNPMIRAYSHYQHSVRNGRENLSFEDAIKEEETRLMGELDKIIQSNTYKSYNYNHYSYLARGRYIEQVKRWFKYFPKEQILIIKSENLFQYPQRTMNEIYEFLEIPKVRHREFKKIFAHKYTKISEKTKSELKEYFKPYNIQLSEYVGIDFNWDY